MDAKQQVVDRLKQATNVLVTVRRDPSVDLLSACIGLALALDKLDKHAAAVFSGQVPSTIEFLKPEETLEPTPNSLRDFIIALDKSKADKLRYKVEDKVVRIFITPYKTSITQDDLQFSEGDFNVDVIVALGAHEQEELDEAITVHGRILHDAAVVSINNTPNGNLGTIGWQEISASSISEMVADLVKTLGKNILNEQIATALLTGIVAETGRFSNERTTPKTMSLAGDLMAAGANQQLVASQLQPGSVPENPGSAPTAGNNPPASLRGDGADSAQKTGDGTLEIEHEMPAPMTPAHHFEPPDFRDEGPDMPKLSPRHDMLSATPPHITDVHGAPMPDSPFTREYDDMNEGLPQQGRSYLIDEPTLPANTPKGPASPIEPSRVNPTDVLPVEPPAPLLNRDNPAPSYTPPAPLPPAPSVVAPASMTLPPEPPAPPAPPRANADGDRQTLEEIEESVHSPHLKQLHPNVDVARNQVLEALKQGPQPLEPLASLNANPLGSPLHAGTADAPPAPPSIMVDEEGNMMQVGQPAPSPAAPPSTDEPQTQTQPLDMPLPPPTAQPQHPGTPDNPPGMPPSAPPPLPNMFHQ